MSLRPIHVQHVEQVCLVHGLDLVLHTAQGVGLGHTCAGLALNMDSRASPDQAVQSQHASWSGWSGSKYSTDPMPVPCATFSAHAAKSILPTTCSKSPRAGLARATCRIQGWTACMH